MSRLLFISFFIVAVLNLSSFAQNSSASADKPTRTVRNRVLVSNEMPAVSLEFGKNFKYAGGHSFILYDVARAEQHFFVDADENGRIRRLYWVQFEGYLPDNTHSYDYDSPKTVKIGGLEFFADTYARNIKASPGKPNSDGAKSREFLKAKNLKWGSDEIISQRLVHLIDKEKRNELMIIYQEDLTLLGQTAADLAEGGRDAARWSGIAGAMLDRAVKNMKLSTLKSF